ncbi:MAG: hypothetical protein ACM3SY_21730 [Candidatus Omnitrophota bacterium]
MIMKAFKAFMIIAMLVGIILSVENFFSVETKAINSGAKMGADVFYPDGSYKGCEGSGNDCCIGCDLT